MFDPAPQLVVGLEIGTSKVCAVVGQLGPEGGLGIIGLGQARSRGVRKGEIVDTAVAAEDVRAAIAEAEQMADVEIRSVYLGVSGAHLEGFNNRGRHNIPTNDREIMDEDVQDVVKNAKAINLPPDRHLIHVIRQHFIVDTQPGIINPVGMMGTQLEVDLHVVHGLTNRLQSPIRVVKTLQIEVENIVFNGVASSLAVLTNAEKDRGALVIDLGGGVTEYVVYADGIIRHTGTLAVGGDHVTNDLASGLKVSIGRAEELKLAHGGAAVDPAVLGRTLSIPSDHGLPERLLNLEHLRRIMVARLEETFEIIAEDLEAEGLMECLRTGVVLCGGGARVPGIDRLAERIFGLPVALGRTKTISGLVATLDQPEFATGIGLVKFGSFQQPGGTAARWTARLREKLGSLSSVFRSA
jgi:cell division protein FtsA